MTGQEKIADSYIAPFTILLPPSEQTREKGDMRNVSSPEFRALLHELSEECLRLNIIGTLANGLMKGKIDRLSTSTPTGLYEVVGEGRGLTIHEPEILRNRWIKAESGIGPKMQSAMRTIIDNLTEA